jgi:hypothetical protein
METIDVQRILLFDNFIHFRIRVNIEIEIEIEIRKMDAIVMIHYNYMRRIREILMKI